MASERFLPADHPQRLQRAKLCLEGLSIGDAFGERFFFQSTMSFLLQEKAMPAPLWRYPDDTIMAISIYEVLAELCTFFLKSAALLNRREFATVR